MNHAQLFAFESDFVASLRCIPMAVRFKLDHCLVKLSLRQWSRLTQADREQLLLTPCVTAEEAAAYRAILLELIALRADGQMKMLEEAPEPLWEQSATTPEAIRAFARSISIQPLSDLDWKGLTLLQRFVLLKLSRDNHDNVNFVPALQEFGLPVNGAQRSLSASA